MVVFNLSLLNSINVDLNAGSQPIVEQLQLTVEKPFHYIKEIGTLSSWYYVTGIVKNTGKKPVKHARALVKAETFDGKPIEREAIVYPSRLAPGQKGIVEYQVGETKNFNIGKFFLEPGSFSIDEEERYTDLKLEKVSQEDDHRYIISKARITNTGNKVSPLVSIEFAFFDAEGHVLTRSVSLFPSLKAGESLEVGSVVYSPVESNPITSWEIQIDYE